MPRPKKSESNGTEITVRKSGKQDDLPGVEVSSRKIQELEDLADAVVEAEDAHKHTKSALDDAQENLVASMRRHKKTYYNRPTFGSITLKEPKIRAKVKKGQHGMDEDDAEDAILAEEVDDFLNREDVEVSTATA